MKLNQKNIFLNLVIFVMVVTFFNSIVIAQKAKPPRGDNIPQDSTLLKEKPTISQPSEPTLPTIELKDQTIIGERIISNVPDIKKTTDKTNIPLITANPTGEGKGNRFVPGAGGMKFDQSIFYPTTGINNEIYSSFGNYNDINIGLKMGQQYIDDELFVDLDYRWNNGHINNSEHNFFRNTLSNIHRFNRNIKNKIQFSLRNNTYNFYGAMVNPTEKRSRINVDILSSTEFTGWKISKIRWDAGINYMDPDESQLFNWGLWTSINTKKTVGNSLLTNHLNINSDWIEIPLNPYQLDSLHAWLERNTTQAPIKYLEKVRDDITNNKLLSRALFNNFRSTIEHVLAKKLKVNTGVSFFYYNDINKHFLLFSDTNSDGEPSENELTTVYPIIEFEFNLGPFGALFGKFEPQLTYHSLLQTLNRNPYVNLSAPLSYQDIVSDKKIGWHTTGIDEISFETFYNFKDINNYSIFIPQNSGNKIKDFGHWDIYYGNDIKLHEWRSGFNWQYNKFISLWASLGLYNYEINKSDFADQLPYFPEIDLDFVLRALPGFGWQFLLTSQFIGEQFTLPDKNSNSDDNTIESYLLSNLFISKKVGKNIEIFGQFNNLFNVEYEVWKGYSAPLFNGWGGIKIFW